MIQGLQYFISFVDGLITFISPCHLPMLPIFLYYLAGGGEDNNIKKTARRSLGFILGFTAVFIVLGAFFGLLGELLDESLHSYETVVNIVAGAIVVVFGLSFLGVIKLDFLHRAHPMKLNIVSGFIPAVVFGIVFAIFWMPCMWGSLGPALLLASHQASVLQGVLLLLIFSLGLGIPFLLSAVLIGKLKGAFDWIKGHYKIVNTISGLFLIVTGILMMIGLLHEFFDTLSIHSH